MVAVMAVLLSAVSTEVPAQTVTPGAREILSLNFASIPVGDFPRRPDLSTQSSLEIVDRNGVHMLKAVMRSEFVITLPETLPEQFTLEFDVVAQECCGSEDLSFESTRTDPSGSSTKVTWSPSQQKVSGGGGSDFTASTPPSLQSALAGQLGHIIASIEGSTIKLYTNNVRLYTVSERRLARGQVLRVSLNGTDDNKGAVYIARFRVAEGAATTSVIAQQSAVVGSLSPAVGSTITPAGGTAPATVATQSTVIAPASAGATAVGPVLTPQSTTRSTGILNSTLPARTITLNGFSVAGTFSSLAPRTISLAGFTVTGTFASLAPRTISLTGFTASGVFSGLAPRTISLTGFDAAGVFTSLAPRSVQLTGFSVAGVFPSFAPRTVTLPGFAAAGTFPSLAARTITLPGFTTSGTFITLAPRTISLSGWTAVGVIP